MRASPRDLRLAAAFVAAAGLSTGIALLAVSVRSEPAPAVHAAPSSVPAPTTRRATALEATESQPRDAVVDSAAVDERPRRDLRRRVGEFAGRLDAAGLAEEARAIAASTGVEEIAELARLAASPKLPQAERIAIAEILRHAGVDAPPALVGTLREAWASREDSPVLAAASVRALAAFGDAEDRRALLDSASLPSGDLARLGLSALRGDDAARELVEAIEAGDPGRSDAALAALVSMANGARLSADARASCAEALHDRAARSPRLLAALAALDPARAREPLAACLADPAATDAAAQSAASALAADPEAAETLDRIARDERLPAPRRAVAARARDGASRP